MKVYFQNSKGNEILIGETSDSEEATRVIKKFCRERSFKIPYMKHWVDPDNENRTIVDVSSHVEFFVIER